MRKPLRSIDDLIKDGLLPPMQRIGEDLRSRGFRDVLCSVPPVDYKDIKKRFENDKVLVWIPDENLHGCIWNVKREVGSMFYLSPELETFTYPHVMNICAHELSHLCLHPFSGKRTKSLKEMQADISAIEWGY